MYHLAWIPETDFVLFLFLDVVVVAESSGSEITMTESSDST